jgi:hypothetical protein
MSRPTIARLSLLLTVLLFGAGVPVAVALASNGGSPSTAYRTIVEVRSVTAAPAGARAPGYLKIGIGDESPATFADPRFRWLGMSIARVAVPFDAVAHPVEIAGAARWLQAAQAAGVRPLIVFDHSSQRPAWLPSVSWYTHEVRVFVHRFPQVHDYTAWNEENHSAEPTSRNPGRAAAYFNALTRTCHLCTVVAADVLDEPNMLGWLKGFLRYAYHPHVWGLHNYFDLNHGGHRNTSALLALTHGEVWFTETGGDVWRYDRVSHTFVIRGQAFATRAADRLLSLAALSPRVRRIYYYHWRIPTTLTQARRRPGSVTWDSGLINPDCSVRPAFLVIARALGRDPARIPRVLATPDGYACVAPPSPPSPPSSPAPPTTVTTVTTTTTTMPTTPPPTTTSTGILPPLL